MEVSKKWGFGMAPLKPETERNNRQAMLAVRGFVAGDAKVVQKDILGDISRVKGIFNRIVKQDQWDWFTVNMYMDYPEHKDLVNIVSGLSSLRKAIVEQNNAEGVRAINRLVANRFLVYCDNYLSFDIKADTPVEYLYILSRREEKEILKIGMTTRNVQARVNEINSATGVVFPFSARKVYKVRNSNIVERDVHKLLSEYRIRADREFFRIEFSKACSIIEQYLRESDQLYYSDTARPAAGQNTMP